MVFDWTAYLICFIGRPTVFEQLFIGLMVFEQSLQSNLEDMTYEQLQNSVLVSYVGMVSNGANHPYGDNFILCHIGLYDNCMKEIDRLRVDTWSRKSVCFNQVLKHPVDRWRSRDIEEQLSYYGPCALWSSWQQYHPDTDALPYYFYIWGEKILSQSAVAILASSRKQWQHFVVDQTSAFMISVSNDSN